jgi:hypothetical protein
MIGRRENYELCLFQIDKVDRLFETLISACFFFFIMIVFSVHLLRVCTKFRVVLRMTVSLNNPRSHFRPCSRVSSSGFNSVDTCSNDLRRNHKTMVSQANHDAFRPCLRDSSGKFRIILHWIYLRSKESYKSRNSQQQSNVEINLKIV